MPAHFKEEVESTSPWMSPAVFVRKKSGDIHLCIDYRELNKKTQKDVYRLPLPDEVQDKLSGLSPLEWF